MGEGRPMGREGGRGGEREREGEREKERERERVTYHHGWFDVIFSWTAVPSDHVWHFVQQLHGTTGDKIY